MNKLLVLSTVAIVTACAHRHQPVGEAQLVEENQPSVGLIPQLAAEPTKGTGYVITYPAGWNRVEVGSADTAVKAPTTSVEGQGNHMTVWITNDGEADPKELAQNAIRDWRDNWKEFEILSEQTTVSASGDTAREVVIFEAAGRTKSIVRFVTSNRTGYTIMYSGPATDVDRMRPLFDLVADSFTLDLPAAPPPPVRTHGTGKASRTLPAGNSGERLWGRTRWRYRHRRPTPTRFLKASTLSSKILANRCHPSSTIQRTWSR